MLSQGEDLNKATAIANAMYNSGDRQYQPGGTAMNNQVATRRDSLNLQKNYLLKEKQLEALGYKRQSSESGSYPAAHELMQKNFLELQQREKDGKHTQVISPQGYRMRQIYPSDIYREDNINGNENLYKSQEAGNIGVLNPQVPYSFYDKRIAPTKKDLWVNDQYNDGVVNYGYDFGDAYAPKPPSTGAVPNRVAPRKQIKSKSVSFSTPADRMLASSNKMEYGGIPQYQYGNPPFEQSLDGYPQPDPNYYDQNKTMFQTGQPMYSGQSPQRQPLTSFSGSIQPTGVTNMTSQPMANIPTAQEVGGQDIETKRDRYRNPEFQNPSAGFDIPTAAYTLGQGLQTGNGFDIATGGIKLLTGVGRNVASGMGQANRESWIKNDYNKRVREALTPQAEYGQYGGYFQDGGVQMGQQAPPQSQEPSPEQIIQAFAQLAQQDPKQIMTELQQMQPEEQQQALQQMMQALQENSQPQDQGQDGEQNPAQEAQQAMQMGGQLKKKVIGEHELEQNGGNYVAEVENGEFIKNPNGEIREVVGAKHAQGGVKLTQEQLPNGSEIISDHLKVGKEGAKRFNDDYDLGIKSTDTYATVLDKFNRKSGIKKIVDEQEMVQKNIEKQVLKLQDNPASESTIKLNLQLFTDQFKELQDQKTPLEEVRKVLFDEVFQPQEESKEPKGHNYLEAQEPIPHPADEEYKNGGEKNSLWRNIRNNRGSGKAPTKQMLEQEAKIKRKQMGGMYNDDVVIGYSQKHNIHPDRVRELMAQHQNGGLQQYRDGDPVVYGVTDGKNAYRENKRGKQSRGETAYSKIEAEKAIQELRRNYPDIVDSEDVFKKYIDVDASGKVKFKGGLKLNQPSEIIKILQTKVKDRQVASSNVILKNPNQFAPEAVKEAQRYLDEETFLDNADTFTQDPTKSIRGYDSKLGDFTSGRYSMQMNLVTPEERKMLNDAGVTTIKQLKASPLRQKLSADSIANVDKVQGLIGDTNADYGIAEITPEKKALETAPIADTTVKTDGYIPSDNQEGSRYNPFAHTRQQVMLPDSLQGAVLLKDRPNLVEVPRVSADGQINEIRRQEQSAMQKLQGLPSSQQASVAAQISANSQNAMNQAIAQTEASNQQAKFNTDVANARAMTESERVNAGYVQNYENKITTADAKTQANLKNYYDTSEKIRVSDEAFNINQNLIQNMYNNAKFNGYGVNVANLEKARAYDGLQNMTEADKLLNAQRLIEADKKARRIAVTKKGRFGGKK
jgi:hypothetical protein